MEVTPQERRAAAAQILALNRDGMRKLLNDSKMHFLLQLIESSLVRGRQEALSRIMAATSSQAGYEIAFAIALWYSQVFSDASGEAVGELQNDLLRGWAKYPPPRADKPARIPSTVEGELRNFGKEFIRAGVGFGVFIALIWLIGKGCRGG